MSGGIDEALGIASPSSGPSRPATPSEEVLQKILVESQKQTRHLSVIRWLLVFAWLTVMVGGIRVALR